jgi:hypothetical protein
VSERILLSIDDLNTAERLGLDAEGPLSEPRLYLDRFGEYKVPFGVAVKVAKPCCERCCATCKQRKRSCGGSSSPGTSTRFGVSSTGERRVSRPSYGGRDADISCTRPQSGRGPRHPHFRLYVS